jgi:hypothetical protein
MNSIFLCQSVILLSNFKIHVDVHLSNYDVFLIVVCAGAFLEAIENLGFDYIASGHYAHVVHPSVENTDVPSLLQLSKDKVFHASPAQIDHLISVDLILMPVC